MANREINEVKINGVTMISTREDTVTKETLLKGVTAHDASGEQIVGELDPVGQDDAYLVTDEEGELADNDYLPFYDSSEGKKKKSLFSHLVDKLKSIFVTISGNTVIEGQELSLKTEVDASKPDNDVEDIYEATLSNILDKEGRIINSMGVEVTSDGKIGTGWIVKNYNTDGQTIGLKGISFSMDKQGNLEYTIADEDAFREAIKTIDQIGTAIPNNSDLDNYKTAGTYAVISDESAQTMSHIPVSVSGKLIVSNNGDGGYTQFYVQNHEAKIFTRSFWNNAWSDWAEIGSGGSGGTHTYQDGTAIAASSNLNSYTTAGVYKVATDAIAETLTNAPSNVAGKLIVYAGVGGGIEQSYMDTDNNEYTRVYDGTWYSWQKKGIKNEELTVDYATLITSGDLDSITTYGVYYWSTSASSSIANVPIQESSVMFVMNTWSNNYFRQLVFTRDSNRIYSRIRGNNLVWYKWKEITTGAHTYEVGTDIPANSDLNDYTTEGVYAINSDAISSTLLNNPASGEMGKLLVLKPTSTTNHLTQIYTSTLGKIFSRVRYANSTWSAWKQVASTDDLTPHTYELGTDIPANSDLNTYTTEGVYRIAPDATAITVTNIPQGTAGKLIIVKGVASDGNVDKYKEQFYLTYTGNIYKRFTTNSGSTWYAWTRLATTSDITPAQVGNGYAVATISGSAITATIDGFQLKVGAIVSIMLTTEKLGEVTLNINSTGAKYIKDFANEAPKVGFPLYVGINTFIYDGTYYRRISLERTPYVSPQNYVADTSGSVLIDWGYSANRAQIKYGIGGNKLRWNYYKNSAWRGDVTIADYDDIVHQTLGRDILDNADFNDYTTNGIYRVGTNARAQTISNIADGHAGKLVVMRVGGDGYLAQFYISYRADSHSTNGIYWRTQENSTWTQWLSIPFFDKSDNMLSLLCNTTTEDDKPVGIRAKINDTTTGKYYERQVIKWYQDHQTDPYGFNLVMDSGGNTIIGGGESAQAMYGVMTATQKTNEFLFLLADSNMYLEANANTIANRQGFVLNTSGKLLPVKAETVTDNFGDIGESSHKLANIWTYKINGQDVINSENIAPALAKVGKSILPSWSYTSNTYTSNGITYTFNPSTGEITANGTATNDSTCILAGVNYSYYWLPKGSYTLSGCPSGGSSTKYYICLNLNGSNNDQNDYGDSVTFDLTIDHESINNEHLYICVKSGQTVSNIVFKPMLRPSWTSDTYEPCEDIHKGNCYVGTCTTAADQQKKIAYVDGYFVLRKGVRVAIKFTNTNTFSSQTSTPITLNVNGTGDKNIYYANNSSATGNTGTSAVLYGEANRYHYYVYDGTNWVFDGRSQDNNTTYSPQSLGIGYGTNAEAATVTVRAVTLSNYNLTTNGIIAVKFTNAVPAGATLNVNGKGAKSIYYRGVALKANVIKAGDIATFIYSGQYHLLGIDRNTVYDDLITGTGTAAQDKGSGVTNRYVPAKWTFDTGRTATAGDIITIKIPVAGHDYGVFVSVDNGSNYIPVALNGTGRLTTHFPINQTLQLVYEPDTTVNSVYPVAGGDARVNITGVWRVLNYRDNDTVDPCYFGFGYGTCTTAAATAAKVATLSNYTLRTGGYVSVKFTYDVPANATLNINSRGAKNIYYRGAAIKADVIKAGDLATFVYSGQYHLVGIDRTSYKTNTTSTSAVTAGTSITVNAVNISTQGDVVSGYVKVTPTSTISPDSVVLSNLPIPLGGTVYCWCTNTYIFFNINSSGQLISLESRMSAGQPYIIVFNYIKK